MESEKIRLNKHFELFVRDLHGDVLKQFMDEAPLSEIQKLSLIKIAELNSREEQNTEFLNFLINNIDKDKSEKFISILEKDYWWLANRLFRPEIRQPETSELNEIQEVERIFRQGSVPHCHLLNLRIERKEKLKELRTALYDLKPEHYIVLHGMIGNGKSSLVAEALNDFKLLDSAFDRCIFWIKSVEDIYDLFYQLYNLFGTILKGMVDLKKKINLECQNLKETKRDIINLFQMGYFQNCLIIVDDLNERIAEECIKFFDKLRCKTLIITETRDIMNLHLPNLKLIEVDSLKEEESLELLSKAIDMPIVNKFSDYARNIHQNYNGHTLTMFLIASDLQTHKDDVKVNSQRWLYYSSGKRNVNDHKRNSLRNVFEAVKISLNNMGEDLELFKYFAIFEKYANITTEALMTLWGLDRTRVQNIMDRFVNRSLALSAWVPNFNSHVYNVHNLFINFLQDMYESEVQELHKKLIDNYRVKCNDEFWKLLDDHYVFLYLGHHLKKSGNLELLKTTFRNLNFINVKIKSAGTHDMKRDLDIYKKDIFNDNVELFIDFVEFVENYGHVIKHSEDINIVQLGLQQRKDSGIRELSLNLAKEPSEADAAYIDFLHPPKNIFRQNLYLNEDDVNACFGRTSFDLLVTMKDGVIKLISPKETIKKYYKGLKNPVKVIIVSSPDRKHFLSVSNDGVQFQMQIFDSDLDESKIFKYPRNYESNGDSDKTPSPKISPFIGHFGTQQQLTEKPQLTFTVKNEINCVQFSRDNKYVISCCKDKCVKVWTLDKSSVRHKCIIKPVRSEPVSCFFSYDGSYGFGLLDDSSLFAFERDGFISEYFNNTGKTIKAIYPIHGVRPSIDGVDGCHDMVVLMEQKVEILRYYPLEKENRLKKLHIWNWKYSTRNTDYNVISCINEDNSFIAFTTATNKISVYNLNDGALLNLHKIDGKVVSLDTINNQDGGKPLLMAVYVNNAKREGKIWEVKLSTEFTKFSNFSFLPASSGMDPIVAVPSAYGCQVLCGPQFITKLETDLETEIIITSSIVNRNLLLVGTNKGKVWKFNVDDIYEEIPTFSEPIFILQFHSSDQEIERYSNVELVKGYFVNDLMLVIAVDDNNVVKVNYKDTTHEYLAGSKIVGCYYIRYLSKIVTVEQERSMKLWTIHLTDPKIRVELSHEKHPDLIFQTCDITNDAHSPLLAIIPNHPIMWFINLNLLESGQNALHEVFFPVSQFPTCCSFSPDGNYIAVGFSDGSLMIREKKTSVYYELSNSNFQFKLGDYAIKANCIGNDLKFGAVSSDRIYLGDGCTNKIARTQLSAKKICKDPNSNKFVTVDEEGTVHVIKFITFTERFQGVDRYALKNAISSKTGLRLELK